MVIVLRKSYVEARGWRTGKSTLTAGSLDFKEDLLPTI